MAANTFDNLQDSERLAEDAARTVAVDPTDPMVFYNVACLCAVLGWREESLRALEDAVNRIDDITVVERNKRSKTPLDIGEGAICHRPCSFWRANSSDQ